MPSELRPGYFTELFQALTVQAGLRSAAALVEVADMVKDRAQQSASARSHPYRTPTPAQRGGPPAMISGTLAKSIDRSEPHPVLHSWEIKVGVLGGMYPPYSKRTPSSLYAKYLEVDGAGKSRALYPFLGPAFHAVALAGAHATFRASFAGAWGFGL